MKHLLFTVVVLFFSSFFFAQEANPPAESVPHAVTIAWTLPIGAYTSQNLYRADSCNNFVYLKNLAKGAKQYQDPKVIGGALYKYKLRSVYNGVESADSNIFTVTVPYN